MSTITFDSKEVWDQLAVPYEASRTRTASFDELIEYPEQLRMIGDLHCKTILDIGCGSGAKAMDFIRRGASRVVGIDISGMFAEQWKSIPVIPNLELLSGDLNTLDEVAEIRGRRFDVIVSLMVLGYAHDLPALFRQLADYLQDGGEIVIQVSNPLRWIVEKTRSRDLPIGRAYRDQKIYSYKSNWNPEVTITQQTYQFSDLINAGLHAGLCLLECSEPDFPSALRELYPEKAAWWDAHGGIVLMRYKRLLLLEA